MKPKLYLETTIISYLTAWPSRDLITAAHQQITREWWEGRDRFDLFVSELVTREAGRGDAQAATRRLELLRGIPVLSLTGEATERAKELVSTGPLPEKSLADARHISIAVLGGMDCLLTWNCTHLANAVIRHKIEQIFRTKGYDPPSVCRP